jgi:hypothetical protein
MLINDAQITGSLTVNASSSFQNIIVSGNILPDTTNIRNLGSVDKYFKEIYVSTGSINFVDSGSIKSTISSAPGGGIQIGSVVITTSSIAFVDSTGSVTQNVAQSSSVGPISDYATSASFNSYTASTDQSIASLQTTSASVNVSVSAINTFTSSISARVSSIETVSASNLSRLGSIETFTSSTSARLNAIETVSSSNLSRLSSLENKTGSLATTGSNTFVGTQVITGSLYITTDLIVQGSSSIQNITGSAVNIGTNTIILNTANPSVRYGGISIIDSGSTGLTGSILWDSTNNNWLYQNPSGSSYVSAKFISGPQSQTLGSETGLVTNFLVKAVGDDHISSSAIFDNGSTVSIKSNAEVTGSLKITSTINATNLVGIWSGSAQLPAGIVSGSSQITAGSTTNFSTDVKSQLNTNTVISGSGQVSISSTSGFGTYLNQAVLTTSSPTFSAITIGKNGTDSLITFPAQTNDPGYIKHYESNNTAIMYFNVSDDSNDEFRFGYTGDASTFRLRSDGVILAGTWQGSAIANAYLANSSFHVGTTSISLGRASSSQTLTGVSIDGNAATVSNGVYTNANNVLTAGNKISIQNSQDGGSSRGIYMWNTGDTNWGIYMATSGAGKALSDGTAPAGLDGRTDHAIRFRVATSTTQIGFLWENSDNTALMQLQPNTGTLLVKNRIVLGVFPNSTTNSGEAWIGRASDRNQGTMTVQLGGNSASSRSFEVVDYAWSVVLFSVSSGGTATASGDVVAYSDRRVKENIVTITDPLDKLLRLRGVSYNRTDLEDKNTKIGFIAQEVKDVLPEVVTYNKEQDRYGISYGNMTALLVEAIKEQQQQIHSLKLEIENVKKQRGL